MECQQEMSICNFRAAPGHRTQMSGRHVPCSQWRHQYISEQEETVWMKQLEDDVGVPCDMRMPPLVNGNIHKRIVQQAYVVRDEDSADG